MADTADFREIVPLLERVEDGLPIVVPPEFGRLDRPVTEPCIVIFTPTYWQEWFWSEQWAMWMHRMVSRADQESLIDFCPLCGEEYDDPCIVHLSSSAREEADHG